MLGIAVGMVKNGGYSNHISGRELEEIVFQLFVKIPNCCSRDHHSNTLLLHERLEENAFESVFNDVRTAGVLVRDLTSSNAFKFAHKSFLESLFASFIKMKVKPDDNDERLIGNTISKSLSITDIYSLKFSDEVISHITENIVTHNKSFSSNEALSLINALSKKAKILDNIFFRTKFKATKFGAFLYTSILLAFLAKQYTDTSQSSPNNIDIFTESMLITIIAISAYAIGKLYALSLTNKIKAAVEIWCRACEVQGYNTKDERVLSNKFINTCRFNLTQANLLPIWASTYFFAKEILSHKENKIPKHSSS